MQRHFLISLLYIAQVASQDSLVWPPPQHIQAHGPTMPLSHEFSIQTSLDASATGASSLAGLRLADAASRYTSAAARISPPASRIQSDTAVRNLQIRVASANHGLSLDTRYDYELAVYANGSAVAFAESVYGAMYAMETFVQLIDVGGHLRHSNILVRDAPQYAWRGLMIDSGRRFFPMETVRNLLDTMAANKLNVLHLHASDHCRFGVESKRFPNLTNSLTGIEAGHYTQQDIKDMISYAGARGIRVVPEFDVPGHSRGFIPLEGEGIKFCTNTDSRSQLYGDPANSTLNVLKQLFEEMAGLFEDEVFNIGCDETAAKGPCTVESSFEMERHLFNYIANDLKKTPAGWEEALFDATAATPNTIVDSWTGTHAGEITKTGRKAIESAADHFYFTSAAPGGPQGWKKCWYGINATVPASQQNLLIGGEMSMWSDTYCYINQCGSSGGNPPVGHALFDPARNTEFGKSIGGMIWPRGFVAAASFWNYNAATDPSSEAFKASIWRLNDQLTARGSWTCPTNCSCDQLTACGKPYMKGTDEIVV